MYQLAWRLRYVRILYLDGIPLTDAIKFSKFEWKYYGKRGVSPQQAWDGWK